jgi:hypothetical protein
MAMQIRNPSPYFRRFLTKVRWTALGTEKGLLDERGGPRKTFAAERSSPMAANLTDYRLNKH